MSVITHIIKSLVIMSQNVSSDFKMKRNLEILKFSKNKCQASKYFIMNYYIFSMKSSQCQLKVTLTCGYTRSH